MIIVRHRIFKVLIFNIACVCYVFFFFSDQKVWNFKLWVEPELNLMENSSSPNKRRRRRRTGKKSATQSLQALYYIFLQEE